MATSNADREDMREPRRPGAPAGGAGLGLGLGDRLADRLADMLRPGRVPNLHGLVVISQGLTALEHYGAGHDRRWLESLGSVTFGPDTLHDIRPSTKSVVGLLYGIALAGAGG